MTIIEVNSHHEMLEHVKKHEKAFVLLYKRGAESSDCARESISKLHLPADKDVVVIAANVTEVRDIHPEYGIVSVPSLMRFEKGEFKNEVKGCHDTEYYGSLIRNSLFTSPSAGGRKQNHVIVYSTPACPHCTTLKNHLKRHGINFRDINVAADQQKAQELVRKTGRQGVPQTEINGQWVLGFDKARINRLLGIEG